MSSILPQKLLCPNFSLEKDPAIDAEVPALPEISDSVQFTWGTKEEEVFGKIREIRKRGMKRASTSSKTLKSRTIRTTGGIPLTLRTYSWDVIAAARVLTQLSSSSSTHSFVFRKLPGPREKDEIGSDEFNG